MIADLKPYLGYKESTLLWLGRCRSYWNLRRVKTLFLDRMRKGFPNEPLLVMAQAKGIVLKEDYENRTIKAQKGFHLLKLVEPNDCVISLRSFQGGIEYAHRCGIINPAYTILKPCKSSKAGYYAYFFKAKLSGDSRSLFVTSIREGRNVADVVTGKLDVRVAATTLPEKIADLESLNDAGALPEDEEHEGVDVLPDGSAA